MKKIIFSLALLLFTFLSFGQTISVESGMIKFNNIADYVYYADNPQNRTALDNFTNSAAVNTLSKQTPPADDDIVPDFLKMFINTDNMFTIGNYYVKFDFANNRLLVLHKNTNNAYATLQSTDNTQPGVITLEFDDVDNGVEIFEGLENSSITAANYTAAINNPQGSCRRANRDQDENGNVWSTLKMDEHGRNGDCDNDDLVDYKRDYKIVYQRFLIYYRIIGKAKCLTMCAGTNPLQRWEIEKDIHLKGGIRYEVRCGGERFGDFDQTSYTDMKKWEPYEGSKSLNRYDCTINMQTKHTWDAAYNHDTPLNIKDGY